MVSAVVAVWGRPNVASYALMTARNKTRVPEKGPPWRIDGIMPKQT